MIFVYDWFSHSKIKMYISKEDIEYMNSKENSFVIANHRYEPDFLVLYSFYNKFGYMGNAKSYVKKVLQWIPVLGYSWKLSGFMFLERSFEKDRLIIQKQLKEVYSLPDPSWVNIF